jgi:hypothetical protein
MCIHCTRVDGQAERDGTIASSTVSRQFGIFSSSFPIFFFIFLYTHKFGTTANVACITNTLFFKRRGSGILSHSLVILYTRPWDALVFMIASSSLRSKGNVLSLYIPLWSFRQYVFKAF